MIVNCVKGVEDNILNFTVFHKMSLYRTLHGCTMYNIKSSWYVMIYLSQ